MRRFSILCLIVLVAFIGVAAKIAAQQASPPSADNDKATPAAQKALVLESIANGDIATAEAACRTLLNNPAADALHEIVDEAKGLDKLPEVRLLYQNMIAARPNDPQVIWLKMGLAVIDVHLADDAAVEAALEDFIANDGSDDRVADAFNHVAWAYRKLQRYDDALRIYQRTVDTWPRKDKVAFAQNGIVICQIGVGDFLAADDALNVLIQNYSSDADASKLVLWSGFGFEDAGEKDRAYKVYGLVVENYPQTAEAITAQLRRALADVDAEDPNRMEESISILLNQFEATQDKAASLHSVADILFWKHVAYAHKPAQQGILTLIDDYLGTIADYTLATWPEGHWALWSQRDLATLAVHRGDDSAAEEALQKMFSDHADDPKLPEAAFEVGEQYWARAGAERAKSLGGLTKGQTIVIVGPLPALPEKARAGYATAKGIWKRIVDDLPISSTTPQAVFYVAECCRALGEDQEAMAGYQQVVDQWPTYEYAWMAQHRIIKGYREMARLGSLSVYESETAQAAAYERLLDLFPSCPIASKAREWLNARQGKSERQLREEAAQRQQLMNLLRSRANQGGSK